MILEKSKGRRAKQQEVRGHSFRSEITHALVRGSSIINLKGPLRHGRLVGQMLTTIFLGLWSVLWALVYVCRRLLSVLVLVVVGLSFL